MAKLFLTLFVVIVLFRLSFAYGASQCSELFQKNYQSISNQNFEDKLQSLLMNKDILTKIDNSRKAFYQHLGNEHFASEYMSILKNISDLIYGSEISNQESIALTTGINKIIDDLGYISPEHLRTEQLVNEDIAIIVADAKLRELKIMTTKQKEDILTLSQDRIKSNSEYIRARKKLFRMIDRYIGTDNMSDALKLIRIEQMLDMDVRYQSLNRYEKDGLIYRIYKLIDNPSRAPIEYLLKRYYSYKKGRKL